MQMPAALPLSALENTTEFLPRHIGIDAADEAHMLSVIGEASRRALIDGIVPRSIARSQPMDLPPPATEAAALAELKAIASKNQVLKSFIGQGYYGTHTPGRDPAQHPGEPRLVHGLHALPGRNLAGPHGGADQLPDHGVRPHRHAIANASMLDEATAAAEAMTLAKRSVKAKGNSMIVSGDCHPQTIEVIQTRAAPLGLTVKVAARATNGWPPSARTTTSPPSTSTPAPAAGWPTGR
jgi:glycine dehydrogenase